MMYEQKIYVKRCPNDPISWIEVQGQFDVEGELHICINEMIDGKFAHKEQCVYLNEDDVRGLIKHLTEALDKPRFGEYVK